MTQVQHIRTAHDKAKSLMPIVAASITILGVVLSAMEKSNGGQTLPEAAQETTPAPQGHKPSHPLAGLARTGWVLGTSLGRVLLATFLVLGIVGLFAGGDVVTRAVTLTVLLLLVVWLASVSAERRRWR